VVPLALLRAQGRYRDYLRLTGIQVLLTTALAIVFVAILRWGVTGWVLASAAGSVLLLALALAILRHRWTWDIDLQPLGHALAFGLPLLPHALAHWGLALSDRAILGAFVPDAEIGQYYVAYQACLPVTVLAIAVSRATQPTFAAAANSEQRRREIAENSTIQAVLVALAAASIALMGPPLIRLALPLSYARAAEFLPWLALGSGLFGLYLIPMNAIAVMAGRTRRVWIITVLAAALNIGLNLVTIPRIGAQAAAINTAVGYGALLVGVTIYMRRGSHPQIPFEEFRLAKGLGLVALAWLLAALLTPSNPTGALVMGLAAMVGASTILVRTLFYREAIIMYRAIRARGGGMAP
jgi:O-antigen/teichoic acid export membrane protein